MKVLRRKLKEGKPLNGLERLLVDTEKTVLPKRIHVNPTSPYERGMMISISNNKMHWETLVRNYKDQYLTLLYALTGRNTHSRHDIKCVDGIPDEQIIFRLIHKKIPFMVCGVHDYEQQQSLYGGSLQKWEYQHQHLYVYGLHHHLKADRLSIRNTENKIVRLFNPRYTNTKRKRIKNAVRLTEVGVGQYCLSDPISPSTIHDYLTHPVTGTLIHYIKQNRHNPTVQYPLKTIYLTPTKNAI